MGNKIENIFKRILTEREEPTVDLNPNRNPALDAQLDDEELGTPIAGPEQFSKQIEAWIGQLETFNTSMTEMYKKAGDLSVSSEFSMIYDKIKSPLENITETTGKLIGILQNMPTEIKVKQKNLQQQKSN